MKLAVIGQGYVGLPLAMRAADCGVNVVGVDLDSRRIDSLLRGVSFVEDVSSEQLRRNLANGTYIPTMDYTDAHDFDVAVITVPTPLRDKLPDLSFIVSAAASLGKLIRPGVTVVLESTTYPGTTDELLVPTLEHNSELRAGEDFFVGYSPERIDPGNPNWNLVNTPKVVSGINQISLSKVDEFYSAILEETVQVSGTREAELTKLIENTFRHVNIALVNELTMFAKQLGVNIWESLDAAATKPFGFMKFTPGPGVGGHCLPVDPSYLSWQVRQQLGHNFRFVELANDINDHMPEYVVERATLILNDLHMSVRGARITLIGVSYKKNSSDVREAPSLRIFELLRERGAILQAHDHHVAPANWPAGVERLQTLEEVVDKSDLVVLVTEHDHVDYSRISQAGVPVLDTRNRVTGDLIERL